MYKFPEYRNFAPNLTVFLDNRHFKNFFFKMADNIYKIFNNLGSLQLVYRKIDLYPQGYKILLKMFLSLQFLR